MITSLHASKACAAAHELRAAVPSANVLGTCCKPTCGESIKNVVDRANEEGFGNIDIFVLAAGSVPVSQVHPPSAPSLLCCVALMVHECMFTSRYMQKADILSW